MPGLRHPRNTNDVVASTSSFQRKIHRFKHFSMPFNITPTSTSLFLVIFVLAFFPNIFNAILTLPFAFIFGTRSPTPVPAPLSTTICASDPSVYTRLAALESQLIATSQNTHNAMSWVQKTFTLPSKSRGSYLITDEVLKQVPEIKDYKVGILHLFVQHTSCALSLNENWDQDVR